MIPKIIHYVWLGNGKCSKLSQICINSWKNRLPDYTIVKHSEKNTAIEALANSNRFFRECKKRHLWAFMADYLRLKILYEEGGIYFDTDIQVLKPLGELLNTPLLIGYERDYKGDLQIGTGVIGCEKGNPIIKKCLDFYDEDIWNVKFYTIPRVMEFVLRESNYSILPCEYFTPYAFNDDFSEDKITNNTYTIHWFEGTWAEKLEIRTFMKTKHIKNPVKKRIMQFLYICKYYKEKMIGQ